MSEHDYAEAWMRYHHPRRHVWMAFAGFGLSGLATLLADLPSRFGWAGFIQSGDSGYIPRSQPAVTSGSGARAVARNSKEDGPARSIPSRLHAFPADSKN